MYYCNKGLSFSLLIDQQNLVFLEKEGKINAGAGY